MTDMMYPPATREIAQQRRELAPETQAAFDVFSRHAFAEGALSAKMKEVIAVAVAHVTQCPYCIKGHTKAAALRRHARGTDGGDLGGGRNAGGGRLRPLRAGDRHLRGGASQAEGAVRQISEVRVKRAYDPPAPGDGARVLVDRLWPRGLKRDGAEIDLWLKDVAPSAELRHWFGHAPARWSEFQDRYRGSWRAMRRWMSCSPL